MNLLKKFKKKKKTPTSIARKLVTVTDPKSIISEQFRSIRTNITFSLPEKGLTTILVSSSMPSEGKSTIAANIGVVYAQEGKRVLIVDADMRKPTLHFTFDIFNTQGLSNISARQISAQDAIQETFMVGLYVLTCGTIPPNPSELLASKQLESFIEEMEQYFDIIIFDAPPLLSVADAQILSNKCDGTILIVDSGKSNKSDAIKAKTALMASKARIVGVVMNNFDLPKNSYYYQYYR